jgi:hypothetical protein
MATSRNFKSYEERVRGHIIRAHVVDQDADGFGRIAEWHVLKGDTLIHTNTTRFKARGWLTAALKTLPAQIVRAVPKASQAKRRAAKGTKHKFPKMVPDVPSEATAQ